MKKFVFYLIILKKIVLIFVYKIFYRKDRFCILIRKRIENYLFFQPSKLRAVPLERDLIGKFKPIRFLSTDRVKLYAWYIEPKEEKPTILYLHGQAESILKHQNVARFCIENGFGMFLLSYRGHYRSSGKPSERGVYTDAQSAVFKLKELGVQTNDIIVWGHSLGTVIAIETAVNNNIKGVILQSPIMDIKTAAIDVNNFYCKRMKLVSLGIILYKILLNLKFIQKFDAKFKIKKIKSPILILHSKTDRIAPYTNSLELAKNNNNSIVKIFEKGTHWDCSWCLNSIFEFIKSLSYNGAEEKEVII